MAVLYNLEEEGDMIKDLIQVVENFNNYYVNMVEETYGLLLQSMGDASDKKKGSRVCNRDY